MAVSLGFGPYGQAGFNRLNPTIGTQQAQMAANRAAAGGVGSAGQQAGGWNPQNIQQQMSGGPTYVGDTMGPNAQGGYGAYGPSGDPNWKPGQQPVVPNAIPGGGYGPVVTQMQNTLNNGGLTTAGGYTPAGAGTPATTPLNVNTAGMGAGGQQDYLNQQAEAARRAAGPTAPRPTGYAVGGGAPAMRPPGPATPTPGMAVGGMYGAPTTMSGAGMRPLSPQQTVANRAATRVRSRFTPTPSGY